MQINACKPETKDDEEKRKMIEEHKEKYRKLSKRRECLIIYTDGSMVEKMGFSQVGAAAVGYHAGEEVFTGGRAEVYDAEMAGLKMGAGMTTKYVDNHPEIKHIHF